MAIEFLCGSNFSGFGRIRRKPGLEHFFQALQPQPFTLSLVPKLLDPALVPLG